MPLDHLLSMDHFELAARCYAAELVRDEVCAAVEKWNENQYDHEAMDALADIAISLRRTRTGDGGTQ